MTRTRIQLAATVTVAVLLGLATWAMVAGFFDTTPTGTGGSEIVRPASLPTRPQWLPDAGICALVVGGLVLVLGLGYLAYTWASEKGTQR